MNSCDLEETKHLAYLKFLELSRKPELWTNTKDYSLYNSYTVYDLDKFQVRLKDAVSWSDDKIISYNLSLGDDLIKAEVGPKWPKGERVSSDPYHGVSYHPPTKEQLEQYKKALAEFNEHEFVKAINHIHKYVLAKEEEKRCVQLKKRTEESCRRIQQSLENINPQKQEQQEEKGSIWPVLIVSGVLVVIVLAITWSVT